MSHVMAMMGSLMLIHGGYNCESKLTLPDFQLFDIEEQKWIKTRVMMNGKVIESEAGYGGTIDSDDSDICRVKTIGPRMSHCMQAVF